MCGDVEAIKALKYRYFRCLDSKDWDGFAACFVPDATGDYAGLQFSDRDSLVDYMRTNMGPGLISLHQAHHPEIAIDGDSATGTWYLQDLILVPEHRFRLEGAAFYQDRYQRTETGWLIGHTGYQRTFEVSSKLPEGARVKAPTL